MSVLKPYYQDEMVTFYHGDAREILPHLEVVGSIITDPVWPNCEHIFPGVDAWALLADVAQHFPRITDRLVLVMDDKSDPRILTAIPREFPFVRQVWLRIACPNYAGTILHTADVAYVFGSLRPPRSRVFPGEFTATETTPKTVHPCPRKPSHIAALVRYFAPGDKPILDPFCGSGRTLLEARRQHIPSIGIDIEERYLAEIAEAMRGCLPFSEPAPEVAQAVLFEGGREPKKRRVRLRPRAVATGGAA